MYVTISSPSFKCGSSSTDLGEQASSSHFDVSANPRLKCYITALVPVIKHSAAVQTERRARRGKLSPYNSRCRQDSIKYILKLHERHLLYHMAIWVFQFYHAEASGLHVPVSDFTWLLFKTNYEVLSSHSVCFALNELLLSNQAAKKKTDVLLLYIKWCLQCASVALWKQGYIA